MADGLHKITIPISVVHGDRDPLVPHGNVIYIKNKIANAPLDVITLENRDHFIPWHSKLTVDAALENLIDKVRETESTAKRGSAE